MVLNVHALALDNKCHLVAHQVCDVTEQCRKCIQGLNQRHRFSIRLGWNLILISLRGDSWWAESRGLLGTQVFFF